MILVVLALERARSIHISRTHTACFKMDDYSYLDPKVYHLKVHGSLILDFL